MRVAPDANLGTEAEVHRCSVDLWDKEVGDAWVCTCAATERAAGVSYTRRQVILMRRPSAASAVNIPPRKGTNVTGSGTGERETLSNV